MGERENFRALRNVSRLLWVFGWPFTIGYLHLTFWKGVLAILPWPYYIGVALSAFAPH